MLCVIIHLTVPIALYFATHFYFVTYHTFSNLLLRKIETRSGLLPLNPIYAFIHEHAYTITYILSYMTKPIRCMHIHTYIHTYIF